MQREYTVNVTSGEIVLAVQRELDKAGLRVEQSFDLRSALAFVPDCTCPHHGTALCDCHYNVLLVYGCGQMTPASLIVHGHDHQCWITLADPPDDESDSTLAVEIVRTLAGARLITIDKAEDDATVQPAAS